MTGTATWWQRRRCHQDLAPLRSVVRGLVPPGQRRVHMKDERDSRRQEIAAALIDAGAMTVDARTTAMTHRDGRLRCPRPRSPTSMSMGWSVSANCGRGGG